MRTEIMRVFFMGGPLFFLLLNSFVFRSEFLNLNSAFLGHPDARDDHVNQLDANERNDDSAQAVDQQVVTQQRGGAHGAVLYACQSQRNQGDDDQGIENYGRQYRRARSLEVHDVERVEHRESPRKHRWNDSEILAHTFPNGKCGNAPPRLSKLL